MRQYFYFVILLLSVGIFGCEEDPNLPNLNDTYKFFGVSSFSDDRGIHISEADGGFILGGETFASDIISAYVVKVNSEGEAEWKYTSSNPSNGTGAINTFRQILASSSESNTYYLLVDRLNKENGKNIPQILKIAGQNEISNDDKAFFKLNKIEFDNEIVEENGIEIVNIPNTNKIALLTNMVANNGRSKVRLSVYKVGTDSLEYEWDRIYGFSTSTSDISELSSVGLLIKDGGANTHYVIAGNLQLNNNVNKIFTLEVDDLGNEVNFNFPENTDQIAGRIIKSISKIDNDRYAIVTDNRIDLSTSSYVSILANGVAENTFYAGVSNTMMENTGKSVQLLNGDLILTGLVVSSSSNPINSTLTDLRKQAYIQKLNPQSIDNQTWGTTAKNYYYIETADDVQNKTINIGNVISTSNGGYAVIGTQDLTSNSKMVLMLLDQNGDFINKIE